VGLAVLLAPVIYLAERHDSEAGRAAQRCTVVSGKDDGAAFHFSSEQAANAATIAVVGTSNGMPERAVTIALATALQESGLHNLDHGDRDSLGLFQQRPSQGWGSAEQIMDPAYAAARFYEHLGQVPGYSRLPLTVAAQRVQRSGFPQAYAKHEPDATLLAAAFTGRAAATLTCEGGTGSGSGDPAKIRKALVHDFGGDVLVSAAASTQDGDTTAAAGSKTGSADGGAADGGAAALGRSKRGALAAGKADAEGSAPPPVVARGAAARTVTVPVRATDGPTGQDVSQRGWELAHWAVANSSGLHIERVVYAGREWTASSGAAWHTAGGSQARDSDRVLVMTVR
jgi:hypothetical protein